MKTNEELYEMPLEDFMKYAEWCCKGEDEEGDEANYEFAYNLDATKLDNDKFLVWMGFLLTLTENRDREQDVCNILSNYIFTTRGMKKTVTF